LLGEENDHASEKNEYKPVEAIIEAQDKNSVSRKVTLNGELALPIYLGVAVGKS
tara:strand:+ start:354 stop:515 length:162 start_codon:yes stop_codon:yes gene_type:complete